MRERRSSFASNESIPTLLARDMQSHAPPSTGGQAISYSVFRSLLRLNASLITSRSKLVLVSVMNSPSTTLLSMSSTTAAGSSLSKVPMERTIRDCTSISCAPATSGDLPHTPDLVHPVTLIASWHCLHFIIPITFFATSSRRGVAAEGHNEYTIDTNI